MSHGHLICLQQDVIGQPEMHVQIHLLMQLVLILHLLEIGTGHILIGNAAAVVLLQQIICLLIIHDKCLTDIGILQVQGVPLKEV